MPMETLIYYWTDRHEGHYAVLRRHGTRWVIEWGDREPPGGDGRLQRGKRVSSSLAASVGHFLKTIGELASEPDEVARVSAKLEQELARSQ